MKRGLGYSGPLAARTERENRQKAKEAEKLMKRSEKGEFSHLESVNLITHPSTTDHLLRFMREFLQKAPTLTPIQPESPDDPNQPEADMPDEGSILLSYESDLSSDDKSLVDTGEMLFQGSSVG